MRMESKQSCGENDVIKAPVDMFITGYCIYIVLIMSIYAYTQNSIHDFMFNIVDTIYRVFK